MAPLIKVRGFCLVLLFQFILPSVAFSQSTISLSDAVLKTLELNPGVRIQKQNVIQSAGDLQIATGEFDFITSLSQTWERERLPLTLASEAALATRAAAGTAESADFVETEELTYSFGFAKKFRSGITLTPSVSTLNTNTSSDFTPPENRSDVNLNVVIPLLRNFGEKNSGANLLAAESTLTASQYLSKFNISSRVFITASSYWSSYAAEKNFEILSDGGARAQYTFDRVKTRVDAGEADPVELEEAKARLFAIKSDIRNARLKAYTTRQTLAVAMGLKPKELTNAPYAIETFPEVMDPKSLKPAVTKIFVDEALKLRGDYLSALQGIITQKIVTNRSKNQILPSLEFETQFGYAGLDESNSNSRVFRSLANQINGLNLLTSLTFEWPVQNNAAKGSYLKNKSLSEEAKLTSDNLSNKIASDVLIATEKLASAIDEYNLANESVNSYKRSLENKRVKLQDGELSITDLLNVETLYLQSRVVKNAAQSKYAIALAELRFVTGTILDARDEEATFNPKSLTELPFK